MKQQLTISQQEVKRLDFFNRTDLDLIIHQQQDSHLVISIFNINSDDANNHICVIHEGKNCQTEIYGLTIANGTNKVNLHTNLQHKVGQGQSTQLLKYILADEANCAFNGELYIAPNAQQTSAQQTNRNLLLSPNAKMRTQPQLEIYADDVKASHGASTGQLNESALFYMQQRGISLQSAKKLLITAFTEDIISTLPDQAEQDNIREQINLLLDEIKLNQ